MSGVYPWVRGTSHFDTHGYTPDIHYLRLTARAKYSSRGPRKGLRQDTRTAGNPSHRKRMLVSATATCGPQAESSELVGCIPSVQVATPHARRHTQRTLPTHREGPHDPPRRPERPPPRPTAPSLSRLLKLPGRATTPEVAAEHLGATTV